MSRGFGDVQRRLIEILQGHDGLLDTLELAAYAYGVRPNDDGQILVSEVQLASVRRALRGLVKKGVVVDLGRNWHNGRRRFGSMTAAKRYQQRVRVSWG